MEAERGVRFRDELRLGLPENIYARAQCLRIDEACREHQTEAATCGEKRVSTSHRASPFP